jgi:hypothetical protein
MMINNNNTIKHRKTQTTFFIPILATHKRKQIESLQIFILQFRHTILKATHLYKHTPPLPPLAFNKSNDDSSKNQKNNWKICKRAMTESYAETKQRIGRFAKER